MTAKKLYPLIKELLTEYPALRNSDKELLWRVWMREGTVYYDRLDKDKFLTGTPSESVTRVRRMIQAKHPELRATEKTRKWRLTKARAKGTFVFRENTAEWVPDEAEHN